MDNLDIGTSLDWLGEKAPADQVAAQTVEPEAPLAKEVEAEEEKPAEPAVKAAEPVADEPLAIPQIVDDLGGEDGARQLIPLVRAIQLADGEPGEVGTALHDALLKVFTPDQFSALTWTQYDKYGQLMAEQFIADNPDFLKAQGFVKASEAQKADAYDDDDLLGEDEPSEREKQLQSELNAIKQQLGQLQQKDTQSEAQKQQQAQATVVSEAEKAMFGSVVDKTVGELEGWPEADIQKALRYAFASFNQDQKAVEQYKIGVKYQATKQALLQGSQVKASKAFESYLAEAIEMVDAKRTKTDAKKAPVPPTRREFATTTPGQEAVQPKANGSKPDSPFDPNMLMKAVQERLQARGANQ